MRTKIDAFTHTSMLVGAVCLLSGVLLASTEGNEANGLPAAVVGLATLTSTLVVRWVTRSWTTVS